MDALTRVRNAYNGVVGNPNATDEQIEAWREVLQSEDIGEVCTLAEQLIAEFNDYIRSKTSMLEYKHRVANIIVDFKNLTEM